MTAVRITHIGPTASQPLAVSVYRPDMPAGEPGALMRDVTVKPGESVQLDVPALACVVVSQQP
jgi:hypothetical protein